MTDKKIKDFTKGIEKIKNEDTNISAKSLNSLCLILDMQPKDIFIYEETQEDLKQKQKIY